MVDKPVIAVSWHPSSLGYVYVAWHTVNTINQNASSIIVARSTDGGLTFPLLRAVAFAYVRMPQIVTAQQRVTVSWVDWGTNEIRAAQSWDYGDTWDHEIAVTGQQLAHAGTNGLFVLNGQIRGFTIPTMWFNWANGYTAMTYHAWNGSTTDVYLTYYPCTNSCNFWGWQTPVGPINTAMNGDQFWPAIDHTSSGDLLIPFYDRRDDPNNLLYHEYISHRGSFGGFLHADVQLSPAASNPQHHTAATGRENFIGDYQEIWTDNFDGVEMGISGWVFIPGATVPGEIYLTRVTP